MADELRRHRVAAIAITPGVLRSEAMLEHFKVSVDTWREGGKRDPHFLASESPLFVGRAVAALALDPDVLALSGDVTSSWELSRHYGFVDEDGSRPDWGEHLATQVLPQREALQRDFARHLELLERAAQRVRRHLGVGPGTTSGPTPGAKRSARRRRP
jgi:hypothetical protein